jgi:4,5-dihydroxyphthalate decarboxylase
VQQMRFSGAQGSMLPWLYDEIAEMDALMGPNPWPYGLSANRPMLAEFMQYLVDQKFIEKTTPIDQFFAPIVEWSE